MFWKLFRVTCDVEDINGIKGKAKFEVNYLWDLTKPKYIKRLEQEIIEKSYIQEGVKIKKINNLNVQRVG